MRPIDIACSHGTFKKSVITLAIPVWLDMMAKYVAVLILINYLREKSINPYTMRTPAKISQTE